jgi:hypothetical protein
MKCEGGNTVDVSALCRLPDNCCDRVNGEPKARIEHDEGNLPPLVGRLDETRKSTET